MTAGTIPRPEPIAKIHRMTMHQAPHLVVARMGFALTVALLFWAEWSSLAQKSNAMACKPCTSLQSNFEEVAAAICCDPLSCHIDIWSIINHNWMRMEGGWTRMPDLKATKISLRAHTSHLWPWQTRAATCLFRWIHISTIWLQDFRTWRPISLSNTPITRFVTVAPFFSAICALCIKEPTSTSPCSAQSMKMAWFVHVRLRNENSN